MQNKDTTSKEMREAIRKAYTDYLKLMDDIESLTNAARCFRKITGHPSQDCCNVLDTLLTRCQTLQNVIISQVTDYFEIFSTADLLNDYLYGLKGPSAYLFALEHLTGETFG